MMPIGVPLGGNVTVASYMSYLMKGWSYGSIIIVGRDEFYFTFNRLESGYQDLSNLLLWLSNFADEQYLSCLVRGYHHSIVAMMLV